MATDPPKPTASEPPAHGRGHYQEFLEQRAEIMKHKWILSEKARRDVGLEVALLDWIASERARWRASRNP